MTRSFTDRVLGGVCGGLGAAFRINPWLLRGVFLLLGLVSFPAAVVEYLLLWWILPQGSPVSGRGAGLFGFLLVVLTLVAVGAAWTGWRMGWLRTATGQELYYPVLLLLLSLGYLLRQARA